MPIDNATRIRRWREDRDLSQAKAAKELGSYLPDLCPVSQAAWAAWERKAKCPDRDNAIALERMTGAPAGAWDAPKRKPTSKAA